MTKIAVLVGSLRADSINKRLAIELEALLPEGITFEYADLNLPLYNQDLEVNYPAEATAVKKVVEGADGVLFVTPEHNRGIPAALKNAIDWVSRPWGSNSLNGKPTAIIGASGSLATTQAQQQLRNVALYLNTHLLGQPEMYVDFQRAHDEKTGALNSEVTRLFGEFIGTFVAHINRFK